MRNVNRPRHIVSHAFPRGRGKRRALSSPTSQFSILVAVCFWAVLKTDATRFSSRQAWSPTFSSRRSSSRYGSAQTSRSNYPGEHDLNTLAIDQSTAAELTPVSVKSRHYGPVRSRGGAMTMARPDSFWYFIKVGLSGGIAGAVGSAALYPMDAAKTLRQSSPSDYKSVFQALGALAYSRTTAGKLTWHLQNVYRGVIPATLGAIPSSALYFGAYESMKTVLTRYFPLEEPTTTTGRSNNFSRRLLVHALAAMSGNVLSSAVFVPKELIKQQLQFRQSGNVVGVMMDILAEKGLGGLYVGYKATLMRNIPTAVLRFSLYEEFRYRWYTQQELGKRKRRGSATQTGVSPKFFLAGAAAGVLASGLMTPVDVLKTRLATGTCPVDVKSCFLWVVKQEGISGLYSGAGSRMFFSGAFSAIGFGTFEWAKTVLGVSSSSRPPEKTAFMPFPTKSATKAVPATSTTKPPVTEQEEGADDEEPAQNSEKESEELSTDAC